MSIESLFGEAIYTYTRAQAIEDGVLIEVPAKLQREAGFSFAIAYTPSIHGLLTPPKRGLASYEGRLWDMLTMLRFASRRGGSEMLFKVIFGRKTHALKAMCGPGDNGEGVITVMLPGED